MEVLSCEVIVRVVLAYKFRDIIAILPRPGHRRDKAQTSGTVPAVKGRLETMKVTHTSIVPNLSLLIVHDYFSY